MRNWGVHSEVGILRTVLVRRPGLAHQRLTPGNCHEHRAQVQAASEAYERHKNRDPLVKVKVLVPFRVGPPGREAQSGEIVEVPGWLLRDLLVRGHVERV